MNLGKTISGLLIAGAIAACVLACEPLDQGEWCYDQMVYDARHNLTMYRYIHPEDGRYKEVDYYTSLANREAPDCTGAQRREYERRIDEYYRNRIRDYRPENLTQEQFALFDWCYVGTFDRGGQEEHVFMELGGIGWGMPVSEQEDPYAIAPACSDEELEEYLEKHS